MDLNVAKSARLTSESTSVPFYHRLAGRYLKLQILFEICLSLWSKRKMKVFAVETAESGTDSLCSEVRDRACALRAARVHVL